MKREFSVHCENCKSFPDGHYCNHMMNKHLDKNGHYIQRKCVFQNMYEEDWKYHPCLFFKGEIRIYNDKTGKPYKYGYMIKQINKIDEEFGPETFVGD